MNWQAISGNPFFTVALPILIGMFLTGLWQNKRVDDLRSDMNRQFADIKGQLAEIKEQLKSIDKKLAEHGERLATLEERTGFVKPAR